LEQTRDLGEPQLWQTLVFQLGEQGSIYVSLLCQRKCRESLAVALLAHKDSQFLQCHVNILYVNLWIIKK
jgi:hypothetical protein